ncbi:beta strand repeat-containing protein [Methanobrevibacter sp.]|uniref:beta strand repeat-containing protein n=1 Tax=Methanobrevibacter sp. TaxID=66852 RepID=UPI003864A189
MKKSKISILLLLMVMILAISAVSAADTNDTSDSAIQAVDDAPIEEVASDDVGALAATDDTHVLAAGDGNFTELQTSVDTGTVLMTKDYTRVEGENTISITRDVTILGNDHKIDGSNLGGIFNVNSGYTLTLMGVTLINGNAENGGAIYNNGGTLTIVNSYFLNNTATKSGGAIYNNGGSITVTGSTFDGNDLTDRSTNGDGGAAIFDNAGDVLISSSTITNNLKDIVHRGGTGQYTGDLSSAAVTSQSGTLTVSDSYFGKNSGSYGGAILSQGDDAVLNVVGSTFEDNFAFNGGAIDIISSKYTISNSTFRGNNAKGTGSSTSNYANGGAICAQENDNDDGVISDCTFEDNTAAIGGAITTQIAQVTGCTFTNNTALSANSETYNGKTNNRGGFGGAVYNDNTITIEDSTFTDNIGRGRGLDLKNADISGSSFTNTVINVNNHGTVSVSDNLYDNAEKDISSTTGCTVVVNVGNGDIPHVTSGTIIFDGDLTFQDIQDIVDAGNTAITLTGNVLKSDEEEQTFANGILINHSFAIYAQDYTITANNGKVFTVNEGATLTLNKANVVGDGTSAIVNNGQVSLSLTNPSTFTNVGEFAIDNQGTVSQTSLTTFTQLSDLIALVNGGEIYIGQSKITKADDEKAAFANGIVVEKNLTIRGYYNTYYKRIDTKIDADNDGRIFSVNDGATLTLQKIILINGNDEKGGAVYVEANNNFYADTVNFINNTATYRGGAIYSEGFVNVTNCVFDSNDITFRTANDDNGGAAIYNLNGILIIEDTNITNNLKDIVIRDGNNGDLLVGVVVTSGDTIIDNAYFANNTGSWGGAISSLGYLNTEEYVLTVINSRFEGNNATFGGAIFVQASGLDVKNCTFENNKGVGVGSSGTSNNQGGAIVVFPENANAEITDSTFIGNSAKVGGAVSLPGVDTDCIIDNCTFIDNTAYADGGAVYFWTEGAAVTVTDSEFINNTAPYGGAIENEGTGALVVDNSKFVENEATVSGGAIISSGSASVSNSVFNDNEAATANTNAIYIWYSNNTLALTNNVITGSTDAQILTKAGTSIITPLKVRILDNGTYNIHMSPYTLNATVTDMDGNLIVDNAFRFVVGDEVVDGITINATTGVYTAVFTPSETGTFIVSTNLEDASEIETATLNIFRTLTDLANLVGAANDGDTIVLDGDYTYNPEFDSAIVDGIVIDKNIIIDGNGSTICGSDVARIFNIVSGASLTLSNATLCDGNASYGGAVYVEAGAALNADTVNFNDNTAKYRGGAIWSAGTVNIKNSAFDSNNITYRKDNVENGGAAIYSKGTLTVDNTRFTNDLTNYIVRAGDANDPQLIDAVVLATGGTAVINNSYFENNSGTYGGAISGVPADGSTHVSVIVENSEFINNLAYAGGAIYAGTGSTELKVKNCTFIGNNATGIGSYGYTSAGGAICLARDADATITDSKFINNTATVGGAVDVSATRNSVAASIDNCYFENNVATGSPTRDAVGGAIRIASNAVSSDKLVVSVENSNFTNNVAPDGGSSIYNGGTLSLSGNKVFSNKAEIESTGTITSLEYATFLGNSTIPAEMDDTFTLNATLTDEKGNFIYDVDFKFSVNGETIDEIYFDEATGLYTVDYYIGTAGPKVISTNYDADGLTKYYGILDVPKANVTLNIVADNIVEGENATVHVYVVGINDTGLNTTVKVVVDDVEYTVNVTDGEGILPVSGLEADTYAIFTIFEEDDNYNTAYDSYTFYVKHATTLNVTADEEYECGSDVVINFELDAVGQTLTFIVFATVDGELYTVTVNGGTGTLTISDLPVGNYTVTSYFEGDNLNNYTEGNVVEFKVVKGTPEITADVIMEDASYPGSIVVVINGPDGDYNITVGDQIVPVTVAGGSGMETISNIPVGTHTATVDFAGNDNFNNASITTTSFTIVSSTPEISASAADVWIGNDATVIVTVPSDAQGNVVITVNGKKYTAEINAGTATATISADDLIAGENAIDVTFAGDDNYASSFNSTTVFVLDGVITNATYAKYFDASGYLVDIVPEGATLDFQGLFQGKYPVFINKPVNIITSTGDAVIDSSKTATFNVVSGGAYTNVTGLSFINTVIFVTGAPHVTFDGISTLASMSGVGSGTGFVCFRAYSEYGTVKNSYLENAGNGGSSVVVAGGGAPYLTVDNNIFNITGSSGNIISGNTFTTGSAGPTPDHLVITNNLIYNSMASNPFCRALSLLGSYNVIENNTIHQTANSIMGGTYNTYRNNVITGTVAFQPGANAIVENNTVEGATTIAKDSTVTENTFGAVTISGANANFTDNTVTGTVTVNSNDNTIKNNMITTTGDYAIDLKAKTGNTVTDNTLIANGRYGDVAVKFTNADNVVENNTPVANIEIEANSVWIGNNNTITVTIVNGTGSVTIKVNDKNYTIDLTDGVASQEFAAEDFIAGVNTVEVTYNGGSFIPANATATFSVIDGIITNDTFYAYFDENGNLFDAVPANAELTFVGAFSDLTSNVFINKPVKMTGQNAALKDMRFVLTADGIVLDNMTLFATTGLGDLIGVYGNAITVSNMNITYIVGNEEAIAINVMGVEDANIVNNTILFESHVTTDGIYANAINLEGVDGALVDNNVITTSLTGVDADYGRSGLYYKYGMMGVNTVNPIRIVESSDIIFTNNDVNSALNDIKGYYPTVQSVLVVGVTDSVFDHNNFTMIDGFTPAGSPSYLYAFTFGIDEDITVSNNNFYMETEGGVNGMGTAYALQIVTASLDIIGNNITSISNGPNLGIYVVCEYNTFDDDFVVNIINNTLNITGYATGTSSSALVSGMEIGAGESDISGNTIYVYNKAGYVEKANVYGISYVQSVYRPDLNIVNNDIFVEDGDYAVYNNFPRINGMSVTENNLVAHNRFGDKAVFTKYTRSVVANNTPLAEIAIEAGNVWIGSDNTITVTIPNAVGNVTISVNGKEQSVELTDGVATATVGADDLIAGENTVDVTYDDISYNLATNSTTFQVLDGVITNATYAYYFDASGNLVSIVPNEVTLDFQGLFLGKYPVYINKAVNVISSTCDALFDCGNTYTSNDVNSFNFIAGSDHSNITGLKFMNYCLYIKGASYITVDSVSIVANKGGVGRGTGFLSIHSNAYYALVKNCYMENGGTGSSLLVLGKGGAYVVFDHNYFNITGNSGNVISANQFVGTGDAPEHTTYTNNIIYSARPASAICYAMTVSGSGNLLENNTIYFNGSGILNQYGASSVGNVYRNNTIYGSATFNPSANSLVENNKVYGTGKTTISAGTTLINNTFNTVTISGANVEARENTFNQDLTISGAGAQFIGNTVTGTVTVNSNDNVIVLNNITATGDYAVNLNAKTGNTVTGNILIAKEYYGDAAVKYTNENNVVEDNYPMDIDMIVSAEPIFVGQDAEITISAVENFNGMVTVLVNGKTETVSLTNGKGNLIVSGLPAANHTVTVSFDGNAYFNADKANTTLVVSKVESEMTITVGEVAIDKDLEVTISLPGVTDEVTVIVDGNIASVNLVDGVGTFTVPKSNMTAGDHTIIAIFEGNDQYDATVADANFTVEKEDGYKFDVNLTVDEIDYGEDVSFNVTLPEDANGRLIVSVDDEEVAWADVVNGTATVTIPADAFETGDNEISVTYSDDKYGETTVYEDIYVNELIADLSASANNISIGETAVITVSIPGAEDDTYLTVKLLGVEYDVWLVDGQGTVTIPGLSEGSYTATVILEDDPVYEDASVEVTFNVSKVAVPADAINATTPENATAPVFTVTLPEDATGYLLLDVNGSQTHVPLVNGAASVAVPSNLAPGNYSATVTYTGDDKYAPVTTTKEISVASNVPDSALTIPEDSNTTTPTYAIDLPADAGGYLEVDVDGTKYVAPLVNGSASITVPELSEGKHNVTVTYTGDDKYTKVVKSNTLNVNSSASAPVYKITENKDVSAIYSATSSYKVLVTKDGKAVGAGESVTFTFNGKKSTVKTDSKGYATLKLNTKVKVKSYTVTAEYNGVKVTNKVTIKHVIKAKNKKVKKSKKVTKVKITLNKVNGKVLAKKTLKVKFKGKTYKVKTNKKGVATWKVKKSMLKKLKVGKKYKYKVTYGKDVVTKKLTIKK